MDNQLSHALLAGKELVRAYHARTKHRFVAYAEGPGQLDWDAQPAVFRHYSGAPCFELPLTGDRFERCYGQLPEKPGNEIPLDRDSLGALLELSFGLSAWKSWGPSRWPLRCNPSSGNLHPVEAYVLLSGLPGLPDGLHHYDPEQHALEGRALLPPSGAPAGSLAIALSSVMWREAWKYGERAFRYCQLDVGHAVGALTYAAALLGWSVRPAASSGPKLAHALGLDRPEDFPASRYAFTEQEEAEIYLVVSAPGLSMRPLADWQAELDGAHWQGTPSRIDPAPGYRWPVIDQVAKASQPLPVHLPPPCFAELPPLLALTSTAGAARLIRQRRSAQRFNPKSMLSRAAFYRMLDAVLPREQLPWLAQEALTRIHLLLFVLRVDGLPSGLYLLPRHAGAARDLPPRIMAGNLQWHARSVTELDAECPPHLGLICLAEMGLQELQRTARALSCHQDIASTSAFSLGMLGQFDTATEEAHGYRSLLREAGLIGQVLYLEAEAAGMRGTGIGCFFDDPVHETFGLDGTTYQSVYHFTVGLPVIDERIETLPPYPQRTQDAS